MNLRPWYRVRQFWGALGWGAKPVEEAVLSTHLNAAQIALFQRMCAAEQRHALAVLRTLQRGEEEVASQFNGSQVPAAQSRQHHAAQAVVVEPALAQAALLHDTGKVGGRIQLWHRVSTVLLHALYPALLHRLARNEPHSWRYPFFVLLYHAELSAKLVAGAGTDALAVALIRAHHTAPERSGLDAQGRALLAALISADEVN